MNNGFYSQQLFDLYQFELTEIMYVINNKTDLKYKFFCQKC